MSNQSNIGKGIVIVALAIIVLFLIGTLLPHTPNNASQESDTSWKYDFSDMEGHYENSMYGLHYSATITSDGQCVMEFAGMAEIYQLKRNSKEPIADVYSNGELIGEFEVVSNVLLMNNGGDYSIPLYRTA